jgi:sugar transferase EpsL
MKKIGNSLYRKCGKRALDLTLTIPCLIMLAPVMGIIAVLVRIRLGTPILFRQKRPGLQGHPFVVYKFRTMTELKSQNGQLLPDAQRLTRFGKLLRRSSLDELPELFNVVKGDMSLVGPRPLLMEYIELYTPHQTRRHEVKPGLTGLAQVKGRNAISWEEKFAFDISYIDNLSFFLDLKILVLTLFKVIGREGISQEGNATMEKFRGTHFKEKSNSSSN